MKTAEALFQEGLTATLSLFKRIKPKLERDEDFRVLLAEFMKGLEESERAYRETGAYLVCRECARLSRHTCCGHDMELEVSRELLLVNLFLKANLPQKRSFPEACFFLGPQGCTLLARPILCRNFFCPWFKERLPIEKLKYIQISQEKEIISLFKLTNHLKTLLFKLEHSY